MCVCFFFFVFFGGGGGLVFSSFGSWFRAWALGLGVLGHGFRSVA